MKKAFWLLPCLALCGCNGAVTKDAASLRVMKANDENARCREKGEECLWSNLVVSFDEKGALLLYGNYTHPPNDLGDLRSVRESIYANSYFDFLGYSESGIEEEYRANHIVRDVFGNVEIVGEVPFKKESGETIPLGELKDGDVFLVKKSLQHNYKLPLNLVVSEILYLDTMAPLSF